MGRRTTTWLIAGVLSAGLLAGCSAEETQEPEAPDAEAAQGETEQADQTAGQGSGGDQGMDDDGAPADSAEVTTAESDLGTILVDSEGMTLYLFTQDSPGTSVCTGECLANWPALEGEPTAGAGVKEDLLGSIEREDGTVQATYADWPLYYFVQDSESGDVTGQGVEDVWYVLAPDGQMITDGAPEQEGSRPGY